MNEAERRQLGARLKGARESAGLSQEEVARELGVPRPAVSQMEQGKRRVEALELGRLARLYDRTLAHFAEDDRVGSSRLEALHRTATALSERDRDEVLRFAEYIRQRSDRTDRS